MFLQYFKNYNFYDAPINKDPLGKIIGTGKYALFLSGVGASYDVVMISQTRTFLKTLNCYAFWVLPLTAMACVGSAVTYLAADLRNKDDSYNYILGVLAVSPIFNAWHKRGSAYTMPIVALASLICAAQHEQVKHGRSSVPVVVRRTPRISLLAP